MYEALKGFCLVSAIFWSCLTIGLAIWGPQKERRKKRRPNKKQKIVVKKQQNRLAEELRKAEEARIKDSHIPGLGIVPPDMKKMEIPGTYTENIDT